MKQIKMSVTQLLDNQSNIFTQVLSINNDNLNTIVGTALNRLFEYNDTLKLANDKGKFKSNKPLVITIETENELISTEDLSEASQLGLKVGNTNKSKRTFARKIFYLLQFAYSEAKEITFDELDTELSK